MTLSSLISRVEEGSELASASVRPELIERIESGSGADRAIDCVVAALADIQVEGVQHSWRSLLNEFGLDWAVDVASRHTSVWRTEVPRYTTSLDAVVSLIEQKLPGKTPDLLRAALWKLSERYAWHICFSKPGQIEALPRALLSAFLRALEDSKAARADANTNPPAPKATP